MGGHGIVKVIRKGGSFGQVSVKFLVTQGNATQGLDYSVASSEVVFYSGDTEKEVPIVIINDVAPELAETFTITLTNQTTGGAVVGSVRETEVVIDESDDPRGAFSFESVSGMSEEPEAGTTVSIPITVIRTGGTLGVVGVTWTAFFTGGASKADINPTSGTVYFVTNEARQTFNVSILPDDIPEGPEVVEIRLMEANNDARIERYANVYTLTIMANDNPHGAVEFAKPSYLVEELETTDPQDIELHRIGGTYGQLKVYYSTKQMDLADLVKRHGKREVDYFSVERGYPPNGSANVVDVGRTPKPLQASETENDISACALICLIEKTCIMFEHKADSHLCQWYITPPESGYGQKAQLYVKDKFKTTQLYSAQALSDIDYRSAQNHFIYINESETRASIPVHVIPDDLPELDELFTILLSHVELVGGDSTAGFPNKPVIGEIAEATVTIAANDDANGIFHIYSNDPRATDAGSRVYVEERSNFAVELVIERGGGNIGEVTVEWAVNKSLTTATRNVDYVADGAILNFKPGENQRVITIGIKDDGEPEMDEYIVVEVSNPGGGAAIADQNQVTVVIKANDQVAGLLGLSKHSLIAREGDVMKVNITRTLPALGNVTVYWLIEGLSGVHPASTFKQHQGHAWFQKGATWKEVTLEVLRDDTPEEKEEYELLLFNATTEGIRDSGSANFDEQADRTSITIDASNYPHGVVSFSPSSQAVRLNEAEQNKSIILTVQRKFGAIDLASGQQSNTIKVEILDDDIPEVDEVFLVNLTSVELLSRFATSMQPSLDPQSSTAQITISANDGTQGMVHFTPESINLNVDESVGNVTLHIYRSQGHFGDVSVFYYSQSVPPEGAKADDDFIVAAQELRFAAGEGAKDIQVQIIDDDIAEPSETFEIILASASNGLQLGEPHKATLTILPNDNAAGTVNFESSDNIYIREPSSGNPGGSVVDVRVIRGPGIYGNIRVPFLITVVNGSDQEGDLDPMNGYITFADRESVAVLQIRAIQDNVPEKEELFRLELFKPEGGGQLGTMANRYIYIAENDAPHGLIEIYPHNVRNKSIVSVQEDSGTVYVDVVRSRGVLGRVTAVVMTEQVSATGEEGSMLILPMIQTLPMITSLRVHSFFAHNYLYVLTLSSMARGEPRTRLPGSALLPGIRSYGNETGSIMWRWQGTFIPAQTIETDGAMSATTFSLAGKLYLAIANHGGMGDVEVISMLYHIMQNGTLSVVQDIASKGTTAIRYFSSDEKHFLVVANSQDNYGNTLISSEVLQWNRDMQKFDPVPIQFIPCKAASDATIFTTYGDLYLVITNFYDSQWNLFEIDSMVYKWVPERNQFDVHQRIPTKGAISVTYFVIAGQGHLLIGNSRDDSDVTQLNSTVYRFKSSTKLFMPIQYIPTHGVQTVHSFTTYETVFVVLACTQSNSTIWAWNDANAVFEHAVNSRPAHDLFPVAIGSGIQQSHLLVESGVGKLPNVYLLASITTTSDFVPRRETVTFEPGQSKVTVGVGIVDDTRPEGDEQFIIRITDPGGGSVVGPQNRITVTVLSNDDAHGVVEFSEDSLDVKVEERTVPNQVTLTVVRSKGTSGHISVQWMTTGEHDGIEDIYPIGGKVDFADGQDKTTITITIAPDPRPELDEVTLVTLVDVSVPGSPDKRTRIGKNNVARITVMANDSPHGVVSWEKTRANFDEPLGQGSKVSLKVIREQGTMGTIVISYSTARALNQPDSAQAISGQDYIATQGSISMEAGMGEADVDLFLLPDDLPEGDEVFLVNITGVSLAGGVSVGGAVPSVKRPDDETMAVSINENDNARGIIQFNVTRTPLGVVEVYEGIGSVRLGLSRTKGAYRKVSVSWQAIPDSASAADFKPLSGEVIFGHQQRHATIDIQIVDDPLPEYHESFSVQLLEAKGGAELGTDRYVVINILKNDSPNGLFSFTDTQKSVLESETFGDPNGRVRFDVVRTQGAQGRVHVTWKLSSDAVFDIQPMQGNLTFLEGETVKTIFLETIPDDYLEGEEQYTISLVAADNNADISPNLGDAMLVIQSDPGASGVITILPEYRYVSIGEPSEDYDGTTEVVGVGKFGAVSVTWQLTPRDAEFAQTSGTITFRDMQENATIVLQAVDDMKPELRHDYVLALVSVSGGAVISTRPGMNTATVAMAASDYPHGLFHFTEPQVVRVSEDAPQLSLPVVRSLGSAGQVLVQYSTVAGTAVSDRDFRQIAGSLTFGPGDDRQNILIAIRQDLEPEGDEHFNVSLASVRLISPASNDYVKGSHGYSLDMSPDLGTLVNKTVIIEKNDNAEGTIEFGPSAVNFLVKEESSMAYVPVVRTRGTFGIVSASYTSRPITALSNGIDYLLPDGEVVFPEGVGLATINVTIVDDSAREVDEAFEIMLTRVHGGAKLGDLRVATVTITQSDFPYGKIGFTGSTAITIPNPDSARTLDFTIQRTEGLTGRQTVRWHLLGPNGDWPTDSTDDISYRNSIPRGVVTFNDGDMGSENIALVVNPYRGPEIEKVYNLVIDDIRGRPGSAEVSPTAGNVTLKILKHGDPNGIVKFVGSALQSVVLDEPSRDAPPLMLTFPISRSEGTVGSIEVHWEVKGPKDAVADIEPYSGVAVIPDSERNGQIVVRVLPENEPELTENFMVVLSGVKGGAEIARSDNSSSFTIKANDDPHGVFSISPDSQTVIVTHEMNRQVQLNITREGGAYGPVRVAYDINYEQGEDGVRYVPTSGSVSFRDGQNQAAEHIDVAPGVRLDLDSYFIVTLTAVTYLGSHQALPPRLNQGSTSARIYIPQEAANSQVGFLHNVVTVNEVTNEARFTIYRWGSYGEVEITWLSGLPKNMMPGGFLPGIISPQSDQVTLYNGESSRNVSAMLLPKDSVAELFAAQIVSVNARTGGTATVKLDMNTVKVDPHGVIQFAPPSRILSASESFGEVKLDIMRAYGSEGKVRLSYQTWALTAMPDRDYTSVVNGALVMDSAVTSATIVINIISDTEPETNEEFFVNITGVEILPTVLTRGVSPRLSDLYSVALVTILGSNDPYGIISFRTPDISVRESNDGSTRKALLQIERTGGSHGKVAVTVRTIGGGELWEKSITPQPGNSTDNIAQALAAITGPRATAGDQFDYLPLTQTVTFEEGEILQTVNVIILDDPFPEPDEMFFVYLSGPTGGARIATGSRDGWKKGYAVVTIEANDLWNGRIGFAASSNKTLLDEDGAGVVTLNLTRYNAFFGRATVNWRASYGVEQDIVHDSRLSGELLSTAGQAVCEPGQQTCSFTIGTKQDKKPEKAWWFLVVLDAVGEGAELDRQRQYANITVMENDYPFGLVQFNAVSRFVTVSDDVRRVTLGVERTHGDERGFQVGYTTQRTYDVQHVAGVSVYPALSGADFTAASGVLTFAPGEQLISFPIYLTPERASANPLPKIFQVRLTNPTDGAELNKIYAVANITIVGGAENSRLWAIRAQMAGNLGDDLITRLLDEVGVELQRTLPSTGLSLVEDIIESVLTEGLDRPLPFGARRNLFNIFCLLMDPTRHDTRGHYELAALYEKFAYTMLTGQNCDGVWKQLSVYTDCPHTRITAYRQLSQNIPGHTFTATNGDSLRLPEDYQYSTDTSVCKDLHFIEYSSQQWFPIERDVKPIVDSRILSVGIRDEPSRYVSSPVLYTIYTNAGLDGRCVYFSESAVRWTGSESGGLCEVIESNSRHVQCACRHLSSYGVLPSGEATTSVPVPAAEPQPRYGAMFNIWFFVSCFVAMLGLFSAIFAHHVCSIYSRFTASLLMHMCFACLATEVVYVINAYMSADILADKANNSCISMGIFLHYFFVAQFTWMVAQAFNLWKTLVMNDEHTERKYVLFFLIGWGTPAVIVAIFYAVAFNLYRYVFSMDPTYIYGDVHQNHNICFIMNVYSALASVIAPWLLLLVYVVAVFVQAYQVLPQWHSYDDIYRGRYNYHEVRAMLIFWGLIVVTWIWGSLHLAYGYLWLLVLFCIFNIVMGVYALVVYAALRHPCLPCFRPVKEGSYGVASHPPTISASVKPPPVHEVPWESVMQQTTPKSTMQVKRTPAPPNNVFILPPNMNAEENETSDFDDLIFALKTGGQFLPERADTLKKNRMETHVKPDTRSDMYGGARRIPIADTHL
ncbi:PREDICTED: G-protein coupled receptor 98-like isoform X2 [Priapulus caudatus]|uniref:G-protein coupled receptor 98-like isoform X2 n=1 Tax=Priapulus caudatus TaxID=37621 RepID=A0ABM1DSS7_PRICU|nr:PREDICTED: G-protein coupled receptor 98-like isoform X2 [Priapulus caudatus]